MHLYRSAALIQSIVPQLKRLAKHCTTHHFSCMMHPHKLQSFAEAICLESTRAPIQCRDKSTVMIWCKCMHSLPKSHPDLPVKQQAGMYLQSVNLGSRKLILSQMHLKMILRTFGRSCACTHCVKIVVKHSWVYSVCGMQWSELNEQHSKLQCPFIPSFAFAYRRQHHSQPK